MEAELANCTTCGKPTRPGAQFCGRCGSAVLPTVTEEAPAQVISAPLSPDILSPPKPSLPSEADRLRATLGPSCPACHGPVLARAAFCPECGVPLGREQNVAIPHSPPPAPFDVQSRKLPVAIIAISVILVAVVLAFIAYSGMQGKVSISPPATIPAPAPPTSAGHETAQSLATSGGNLATHNEIEALITRWADSFRQQNMDVQAECYAPVVDDYFRKRVLDRTQIKAEREKLFEDYGPVKQFVISNIVYVSESSEHAVVRFQSRWELSGRGYFAGEDIEELTLKRIDGDWKIIREEEPSVLWVKKHRANS